MACAPRRKFRATKIAFKILGLPAPLKFKRSKEQQRVHDLLSNEESSRVK
jgi:hypothetical protein